MQKGSVLGGSLSLVDKTGKQLQENINLTCSEGESIREDFSEGLLPVRLELPNQTSFFKVDGCGFINLQGNTVIPPNPKIRSVQPFSEGLAAVKESFSIIF